MVNRRWIIGTVVVGGLALLGAASAFAVGGHAGHHGMMRRMAFAMIDEALDQAQVTPEQRTQIYAARDRAFATIEAQAQNRDSHMEQVLQLFEADTIDTGQLDALHAQQEAARQQVGAAIKQAVVEAHDVLTPVQRKAVADFIREHHRRHM